MNQLRERFLRLSQLQKMIVFGGLGLVSGWATTTVLWLVVRGGPSNVAIPALTIGPGFFLGQLVLTPLTVLRHDPGRRWTQPLISGVAIHFVPMLVFGLLMSLDPTGDDLAWTVQAAIAAGCLGGLLLGVVCLRPYTSRNQSVLALTTLSMGCAAGLTIWGNQRLIQLPAVSAPGNHSLAILWLAALVFVTLHVTAAVCLSVQEWPAAGRLKGDAD